MLHLHLSPEISASGVFQVPIQGFPMIKSPCVWVRMPCRHWRGYQFQSHGIILFSNKVNSIHHRNQKHTLNFIVNNKLFEIRNKSDLVMTSNFKLKNFYTSRNVAFVSHRPLIHTVMQMLLPEILYILIVKWISAEGESQGWEWEVGEEERMFYV